MVTEFPQSRLQYHECDSNFRFYMRFNSLFDKTLLNLTAWDYDNSKWTIEDYMSY